MGSRTLYDPMTMAVVGLNVVGGMVSGAQAERRGNQEAGYLRTQNEQEKVGLSRDLGTLGIDQTRTLARSRAIFAAGGGDASSGSAAANVGFTASVFGGNEKKLMNDSEARQRGLLVRAANTEQSGRDANTAAIMGGIGRAAGATKEGDWDKFKARLPELPSVFGGYSSPYGGRTAPRPD